MRYTQKELTSIANRIERAARELGMLKGDDRLILSFGSKVNGIAYRLNVIEEGETGHGYLGGINDFLGMTSGAAGTKLQTIAQTLEAVLPIVRHDRRQILEGVGTVCLNRV